MELKSYYDFALDDYKFLMELKENSIEANSIGAISQNTCERFLKHIINEYVPVNTVNRNQVTDILTTHNLNRLVNFWNSFSMHKISTSVANNLKKINGFYYSTKYPGDDCQTLNSENIKMCFYVVESCKNAIDEIIQLYNNQFKK